MVKLWTLEDRPWQAHCAGIQPVGQQGWGGAAQSLRLLRGQWLACHGHGGEGHVCPTDSAAPPMGSLAHLTSGPKSSSQER